MTSPDCQSPLGWDTLLTYWLGELDPDRAEQIEEHYLGCAQCSRRLEQMTILTSGIRALARTSGVDMVINDEFVRRLMQDGLRVREYRVPRNGSVNCSVNPEDDFIIGRLETPLTGVRRIDMLILDSEGKTETRQQDIPFVAESGGVVLAPSIQRLRAMPAFILRVRLIAVDKQGERRLGDYTFKHTPHMLRHPQ